MKTAKFLLTILVALVIIQPSLASGDHGHSHDDETVAAPITDKKHFSVEANSGKYELLLRYEPIHPSKEAHLALFVSEFATNKAVDSAVISITSPGDATIKFEIEQSDKGIYEIHAVFPEKKIYSLAVNINSSVGPDLILLQNIEVGKELPKLEVAESDTPNTKNLVFIFVGGLAAGLLLMFLGMKFFGRKTTTLLLFLCLLPIANYHNATAHEGHDDAGGKGNTFGSAFEVPKETQFLFEVLTFPVKTGDFTESTQLFGTVVPASNGQALISVPQNGKVISMHVKVGQSVGAGQLLAVVEQNIEAGAQVSLLAEKNNAEAEYEAAKREYDRLKSIADIVAKKDLSEAEVRLSKAEENRKLFNSNAGKIIELRSPISGVVDNFQFSIGSTVNANETLFTVTNLSKVYVEAQVFDKDAEKVNAGAKFSVECTNDEHQTDNVKLIAAAQAINPTNQSQRVLFEIDNSDAAFKIGEFVNVRVFASSASREIALPNSAISEINGRPVVFIKDAAEKYSVSYISAAHNNGTFTTILKGVEESERVVVNGTYQMKMIYLNQ